MNISIDMVMVIWSQVGTQSTLALAPNSMALFAACGISDSFLPYNCKLVTTIKKSKSIEKDWLLEGGFLTSPSVGSVGQCFLWSI